MLYMRFVKKFKLPTTRQLSTTLVRKDKLPTTEEKPKNENRHQNVLGSGLHVPTNFDKRILVWMKVYPSMDKVPQAVPWNTMYQSSVRARIRVCNYMILIVVIGFLIAAYQGKTEAAGGRHVIGDRAKWYAEIKEKGKAEAEAKRKAEAEAAAKAAVNS
ncbi:UPF0389 protein CG9231 [Nomia melanderi]|uniref:UPF0389 protein CG9231 n=1 Tax=Nomia melanderi TaxID=2448451 RepID=UPI0013043514|nr:protein FAM162A-like [Nomia melanderi]XP_031834381.1 protein FAM162A-like [Nomia melanderi]XP_031834383.1 protein FAM162A-like [Nomia melanderi]